MIALFDNDAILKLAAYDLLEDTLSLLKITRESVQILPTAKYRLLRRGDTLWKGHNLNPEAIARITEFVSSVEAIVNEPSAEVVDLLIGIPGIDRGEAVLYASSIATDGCLTIVTGDKKSLEALACTQSCQHIVQCLQGKIFCIEQLIQAVIAIRGFTAVKKRILPNRDCDKAVKVVFGSGQLAEETSVQQALHYYIGDLRRRTHGLLGDEEIMVRSYSSSASQL